MSVTRITLYSKEKRPSLIPAIVIGNLAFHHTLRAHGTWEFTEWCVSHVPSGLVACPGPFFSPQECRTYIEAVTPLMDWSLSEKALHAKHGRKLKSRLKNKLFQAYAKAVQHQESEVL